MKRFRFSIRQLLVLVALVSVSAAMYSAFRSLARNPEHARIQGEIDKWKGLKGRAVEVLSGQESGNKEWAEYCVKQADTEIPILEQELRDADWRYEHF